MAPNNHRNELIVLSLIGGGLIAIVILIVCGLFGWFESKVQQALPNWAENVLVAISTAATLKLGDVLAALVTLATGRQTETFGQALASSTPAKRPPDGPPNPNVKEAVEQVAGAAESEAERIKDEM